MTTEGKENRLLVLVQMLSALPEEDQQIAMDRMIRVLGDEFSPDLAQARFQIPHRHPRSASGHD